MKKFNWKVLLIVALALVLVFTLIACDGDKDNGKNEQGGNKEPSGPATNPNIIQPSEYFTEMWNLTGDIGNEKIEKGSDVYFCADLGLKVGTRAFEKVNGETDQATGRPTKVVVGYKDEDSFELGIKLEIYIDRTSEDCKNTAIKAKFYSGAEEILGLYYTLATPDSVFLNFADQHIQSPLHFEFSIPDDKGGSETYSESSLGALLKKMLGVSLGEGQEASVNDFFDALTGDMGEDWDLDNLINSVLPVFGFSPEDIVQRIESLNMGLEDYIKDPQTKKLSIKAALTSSFISSTLQFKAAKMGDKYVVTAPSSSLLFSEKLLDIKKYCGGFAQPSFGISFEKDGDRFKDGVTIGFDIEGSMEYDLGNSHPFAALQIKDLEIGDGAAHKLEKDNATYTKDAQFETKHTFEASGVKVNGEAFKDIELGAKIKLDLEQQDATQNATQANIYLKYGEDSLIEASYVGGRLALTVNSDMSVAQTPVFDLIVEAFGDAAYNIIKDAFFEGNADDGTLKALENALFEDGTHTVIKDGFKGAVWTGIDAYGLYASLSDSIIDELVGRINAGLPKASAAEEFKPASVSDLLYLVFSKGVKTLDDGKMVFGNDDMLGFVCEFANTMYGLSQKNKWTAQSCERAIADAIIDHVAESMNEEGATIGEQQRKASSEQIEKRLESMFSDSGTDGLHIEIDGVDFTQKDSAETYLNYLISSLFGNLGGTVTFDLTSGLSVAIEATAAGANISFKSEVYAVTSPQKQKDLAEGVTEENAAEQGWLYFDLSKQAA